MHPATIATAFATIFFAELPDKTMLATIVLSARFRRPVAVWIGSAVGLATQVLIAVTAGRLLSLLPDRPVKFAVAVLFAVGSLVLWRSRDGSTNENDDQVADDLTVVPEPGRMPWQRVSATVFGVVFIAEWGDLTQLATASLAAKGYPVSVFIGAATAMLCVAAIGVVAGRSLLRIVPERVLHRIAAVVFGLLALYFLYVAITEVDVSGSFEALR